MLFSFFFFFFVILLLLLIKCRLLLLTDLAVFNPCRDTRSLLIVSQSDSLIQIVVINSHSESQTVQILISWLLNKPADLDLHCLLANSADPDQLASK